MDEDDNLKLTSDNMLGVVIVGICVAAGVWTFMWLVAQIWH